MLDENKYIENIEYLRAERVEKSTIWKDNQLYHWNDD
jgi:hypothetical protein